MEITLTRYMVLVLKTIYESPGIRIVDIAKKHNISLPTLSRIIKTLQEKKLIKVIKEKNGRAKRVYPYVIACGDNGVVIVPYILFDGDKIVNASLLVLNCPYAKTCPLRGKGKALTKECRLYNELPEEIRIRIDKYQELIRKLVENATS